ncbi:MAG: phage portal protein [Sedimentisphaerales bacterium]|nr:phage portal protein [Sedimentisphaerales bacterium]
MIATNGHARLSRILGSDGRPFRLAYDAVESGKKRRRPSTGILQTEDQQLPPANRRDLVSEMRDLQRNFSLAAWAIRKHLDFVSTFTIQFKTGDKALDQRIEDLLKWWGRAENLDIAARHPWDRFWRLAEARAVVDGDVGVLKLQDGRLQAIEGDRIRTPWSVPPGANIRTEDLTHGVKTDAAGRAMAYCVCRRGKSGSGFEFERMVSAGRLLLHGYFDRFDQVRGITPMASGYNSFQDTYEGVTYALLKAKAAQLFGLKVTRADDGEGSFGEVANTADDADDATETAAEKAGYEVNFGRGPFILDMDPGDDAGVLEAKTPSAEFREFMTAVIGMSLKALDIPYSFYDEAWTNFFGSKAALMLYLKSCRTKRDNLRAIIRRVIYWRLLAWVLDGVLELPAGLMVRDLKFELIPDGMPWWDQSKEVAGDVAAIAAGLRTRTEIRKERYGDDWHDVIDGLAEEEEYIRETGVTITSPAINVNVGVAPVKVEDGEEED